MSKFVRVTQLKDKELCDVQYQTRSTSLKVHASILLIIRHIDVFMFCILETKLQIRFLTQQKCKSQLEEGDVSEWDVLKFYSGVRAFFESVTTYRLQNLPHKIMF